jgi:hypothetical protein
MTSCFANPPSNPTRYTHLQCSPNVWRGNANHTIILSPSKAVGGALNQPVRVSRLHLYVPIRLVRKLSIISAPARIPEVTAALQTPSHQTQRSPLLLINSIVRFARSRSTHRLRQGMLGGVGFAFVESATAPAGNITVSSFSCFTYPQLQAP